MARDISRKRSEIGASSNKNAPKITDSNQQNVIDSIYRELNQLRRSINSSSKLTASTPVEGKSGDIRLYTETANDGSKGYFLQAKFGNSWASGRLSLDELAPKRIKSDGTPSTVQSYESDGGGYITKDDVTYETLDSNNDVGVGNTQVAKGSHVHDHNSANILNTGTNTHDQIDDHIEDLSIHREPNDNVAHIGVVTNQTGSTGTRDKWARSDHQHVLDQSRTYDFTAEQKISVGTGNQALTITGDVDITGNLTVDFAEAGTGDTTVEADLSVGKDVVLNNDATNLSGNVNNTNTTTIHGVATSYNKFIIDYQPSSGNSHLELKYDSSNTSKLFTGSTGNFTLEPTSDIILSPTSGNVIPKGNLEVDLGTDVRKWRSLFIGELVADHLVAQNVMATIGGKILVAPTTTLMEDFPSTESISIKLKHNDPNFRNAFIYLQKADFSNGTVQYEVVETADAAPAQTTNSDGETCYLYVITARNKDSSGINSWTKNDAVVSLYSKGTGGNKGFIELTSSGSIFNNTGPRITAYAASNSDTAWDAAKPIFSIGRIGGYGGVPTNDDTAGLVIGDNLTAGPSDTTNPFRGLVAQRTGMKLFNTPIKMYDGDKLNVLIDRDANGKNVFAIGPEVDESDYSGSSLLFSYVNNAYTLSIDGNIDLSENVDFTIDADDIMNSIDHFLPTTDMGNVSQRGLYLTPGWLGFWETTSGGYWPVKIGATASGTTGDPFFEIKNHPSSPTEFIKYTTDDGLEIAGKVTIIGEQPPITIASTPSMNVDVSDGVNKPQQIYQLTSEATTIYIHVKVENAVNGKIEWTNNIMDEPAPNWSQTVLSDINGSGWFTGEISHSGSNNYRAFRYVNIQADTNHFVKGFLVTKYRPGDPQAIIDAINAQTTADNAIPGNSDFTTSNTITLGSGSIEVGNATVNTGIYSYGKNSLVSNTAGFYLGTGASDITQFGINIGNADSFLKYESLNGNLDIQNASINMLFDGDVDIFIGKDIASNASTDGNADDIMIGTWDEQTDVGAAAGHGILIKHGADDYSKIYKGGFNRRGFNYPVVIYTDYHWGGPVNLSGTNVGTNTFNENYFDYANHSTYGSNDGLGFITKENKISYFWGYDKTTVPSDRKLIWTFTPSIKKNGWGATSNDAYSDPDIYPYTFWGSGSDADTFTGGDGGGSEYHYDFCFMHYESTYDGGYNDHSYVDGDFNARAWGNPTGTSTYKYNGHQIPSYIKGNLNKSVSFGVIPPNTNVSNLWLICGRSGRRSELGWESHVFGGILTIQEVEYVS